jgi:hypothetical protein
MADAYKTKTGTLTPGQRVLVHLNILKTRQAGHPVWSVSGTNGKVIQHTDTVSIACERIKVSETKLERVRAGGKKEVCLWAVGTVVADPTRSTQGCPTVSINPLHADLAVMPDGSPYRGGGVLHFTQAGTRPALSA